MLWHGCKASVRLGVFFGLVGSTFSVHADFTSAITSISSGKCLTPTGGSTSSGAAIVQLSCTASASQQVRFREVSGQTNTFSLEFEHSGLCAEIENNGTGTGAALIQSSCDSGTNQHFLLTETSNGIYSLQARHSNLMLDVFGNSTDDNVAIIQWTDHGGNNQRWAITVSDDATQTGSWGPVIDWPMIAISAANLPDGRILTWSSTETNSFPSNREFTHATVFDPANNSFTPVNSNFHDMFCAGLSLLEDGRLVASGGNPDDNRTSTFDPVTMEWSALANMNDRRWYATNLTLPDNRIFSTFGKSSGNRSERYNPFDNTWTRTNGASMQTLLSEQNAENSQLTVNNASDMQWWGQMAVTPDGSIFHGGPTQTWHLFDANGNGNTTQLGQLAGDRVRMWGNIVSYDVGKVMMLGGSDRTQNPATVTSNVYLVDLNGATPQVTQGPSMAFGRANSNSLVLPTGDVIVIGGNQTGRLFNDENSVFAAELWSPQSNSWQTLSSMSVPRNYHSTALLLKDARVLSMGGGACGNCTANHLDGQIFTPPYLLDENGNNRTRPSISSWPVTTRTSDQFTVDASSAIQSFSMIRLSSTTHAINTDQRFIPVPFTDNSDGTYTLNMHANPNVLIPGNYWLFAVDQAGTPSIGQTIRVVRAEGEQNTGNITFEYYEGEWNNLPDFDTLTPIRVGQLADITLEPKSRGDYYAFRFTTTIDVAAGNYTFYTASDDGSQLFINDQLVVNNDGLHGVQEQSGSITLDAGEHTLIVTFFERLGGDSLSVSWSGPGFIKRNMVESDFVQATGGENGTGVSPTVPPFNSSTLIVENSSGDDRIWNVNPDNDSVSVMDRNGTKLAEIPVGSSPWSLSKAPLQDRVYVVNKDEASISIIDTINLQVLDQISLPRASRPHGIAFAPDSDNLFVALEGRAELHQYNAADNTLLASLALSGSPRHLTVSPNGERVYVSNFITPPLDGESTLNVDVLSGGGEVFVVDAINLSLSNTISIAHADTPVSESAGPGLPNYLNAPVITPDGEFMYLPSKQDNIDSGSLRGGLGMNFDQTVRAVSSRINLNSELEEPGFRIQHDNASVATGAAFSGDGRYLFVALETSREIAIYDLENGFELERLSTGRAPQGLALSNDGTQLFVHNFMDRSVTRYALSDLFENHLPGQITSATTVLVENEQLSSQVLLGKQHFYDAADDRLALDNYMSCASCHNDAMGDGRVWDLGGLGEGLRKTIVLKGRGQGHGMLHWSSNFDEVQDFEVQIRQLAGGTGLMTDGDFAATEAPLGTPKAGLSNDLDALAAYLASLTSSPQSPFRNGDLSTEAQAGGQLFADNDCTSCHSGDALTDSSTGQRHDIGTLTNASGQRLGSTLDGLDTPSLLGLWNTAPYLHDGSATSLSEAIAAHESVSLSSSERNQIAQFLLEIESADDVPEATVTPPTGTAYKLIAAHSSKLLDVGAARLTSGGDILQWQDYGGDNQQFFIEEDGDSYLIRAKHSGLCMANKLGYANNIVQQTCTGEAHQRWDIQADAEGFRLVSRENGQCVDVYESQTENGAWVLARDCTGEANQRFLIYGFGVTEPPVSEQFQIRNFKSLLSLGVRNAGTTPGDRVVQDSWTDADHQKWQLESTGADTWQLRLVHSDFCLDLRSQTTSPGVGVSQASCNGSDSQQWQIPDSGTTELINLFNGQCLAIGQGSLETDVSAITWTCGGYPDQKWLVDELP